jgi:mannose-6-phosphate isomerase
LGKSLPPGNDWAESWEIVDHGQDQSTVEFGPLAGETLGQLVRRHGEELLGRHHPQPRFPLLLKFLDAARTLSVQVHPDDARAARLNPPECGKTEAWVVLETEPESVIYAGLKYGVDRAGLEAVIGEGRCRDCLHVLRPSIGDCVFLPAGTVHALGAGLLVAEIQQPSDVTYRLFDWNRVGPDGRPRPLHVEQGLEAIDFGRGPLQVQPSLATERPQVSRLVECGKFILDRWDFNRSLSAGGDNRCHIIAVLQGAVMIAGDPGIELPRGGTAVLPAGQGAVEISPVGRSILLDAYLP